MTRIINYLKNGRGIGTLFLALLAVIITVQVFYASKKVVLAMVPEVQNTLDQLLPIEIENGVVIEPADTVKNVKLKVPFVPGYAGLPVILDTRVDSLDFDELLKSKSSIQISRKNVYVVSKGEVKVRSLGDASYRFENRIIKKNERCFRALSQYFCRCLFCHTVGLLPAYCSFLCRGYFLIYGEMGGKAHFQQPDESRFNGGFCDFGSQPVAWICRTWNIGHLFPGGGYGSGLLADVAVSGQF